MFVFLKLSDWKLVSQQRLGLSWHMYGETRCSSLQRVFKRVFMCHSCCGGAAESGTGEAEGVT